MVKTRRQLVQDVLESLHRNQLPAHDLKLVWEPGAPVITWCEERMKRFAAEYTDLGASRCCAQGQTMSMPFGVVGASFLQYVEIGGHGLEGNNEAGVPDPAQPFSEVTPI